MTTLVDFFEDCVRRGELRWVDVAKRLVCPFCDKAGPRHSGRSFQCLGCRARAPKEAWIELAKRLHAERTS